MPFYLIYRLELKVTHLLLQKRMEPYNLVNYHQQTDAFHSYQSLHYLMQRYKKLTVYPLVDLPVQ
ncbi:Uncharacterised protein [Streptococcus pneumoniae]|nr:Uncharacterised protein [Streptococcus pneumoniae]